MIPDGMFSVCFFFHKRELSVFLHRSLFFDGRRGKGTEEKLSLLSSFLLFLFRSGEHLLRGFLLFLVPCFTVCRGVLHASDLASYLTACGRHDIITGFSGMFTSRLYLFSFSPLSCLVPPGTRMCLSLDSVGGFYGEIDSFTDKKKRRSFSLLSMHQNFRLC